MNVLSMLCMGIGAVTLLYFLICMCYAGLAVSFTPVWLVVSVVAFALRFLFQYLIQNGIEIARWIRYPVLLLIAAAVAAFLYAEGLVVFYGSQSPPADAQYVIVLGARVNGTTITQSLKKRLDAAIEYLEGNETATVIVSGGQGAGEDISEAEAMAGYLIENGVDPNRIWKEDRSTNTYENILYSRALMKNDDASVVIVTNSFHIYRATSMAKAQGMTKVHGLSASTDHILAISYYTREAIAVLKYKLTGAM